MKTLAATLLILPIAACSGFTATRDPVSGQPVLVDDETGATVDVAGGIGQVAGFLGTLLGVPGLGVGAAALASAFLAKKAGSSSTT